MLGTNDSIFKWKKYGKIFENRRLPCVWRIHVAMLHASPGFREQSRNWRGRGERAADRRWIHFFKRRMHCMLRGEYIWVVKLRVASCFCLWSFLLMENLRVVMWVGGLSRSEGYKVWNIQIHPVVGPLFRNSTVDCQIGTELINISVPKTSVTTTKGTWIPICTNGLEYQPKTATFGIGVSVWVWVSFPFPYHHFSQP